MPTLSHLPSELLGCIVHAAAHGIQGSFQAASPDFENEQEMTDTTTLKSLSVTNGVLRGCALPHLWRRVHISIPFDELSIAKDTLDSFLEASHPARQYSRHLELHIDSKRCGIDTACLTSLDARLADAIAGMKYLQSIRIHMRTVFNFARTMHAVLSCTQLKSLMVASRGTLTLPAVQADNLQKLYIHCDVGDCALDLSCFSNLQELSISMEDNSIHQSWNELHFPPKTLKSLKSLALRGFTMDPEKLLAGLSDSLRSCADNNALKKFSYHLARDELDATFAWQIISQNTKLTSLSFTLPILFDARYAQRLVKAFPDLEELELFAFSRAAAWQWPDPFQAYIDTFSHLKSLKSLAMNHSEELSGPQTPFPGPQMSFPVEPTLPEQVPTPTPAPTESNEGGQNLDSANGSLEAEEVIMYGPLGSNFCPVFTTEGMERQTKVSRALFNAIPTLERVKFEPGALERIAPDLYAYKISENLYERP